VHSKPGRGGEGEHADGVVVHPMRIDGVECRLQMFARLGPLRDP
jgi:hypothetical protein